MGTPKNPALFFGGIAAAIVAIVISVYYAIPGYPHLFISQAHGSTDSHPTHMVAFAAIAIVCVFVSIINRPRSANR